MCRVIAVDPNWTLNRCRAGRRPRPRGLRQSGPRRAPRGTRPRSTWRSAGVASRPGCSPVRWSATPPANSTGTSTSRAAGHEGLDSGSGWCAGTGIVSSSAARTGRTQAVPLWPAAGGGPHGARSRLHRRTCGRRPGAAGPELGGSETRGGSFSPTPQPI